MTEPRYTDFDCYSLTEYILEAPALAEQAEVGGSVLFDTRLDAIIERDYKEGIFDCVLISHVPLTLQGENVSQEDHETRCWIRGSGFYDETTTPSSSDMDRFLKEYLCLIKEIHDKKESVLFHPFFFDEKKFGNASAPPICQTRLLRHSYQKDDYPAAATLKADAIQLDASHGYHHTERVGIYDRRQLDEVAENVNQRVAGKSIKGKNVDLKEDVRTCLLNQHKLVHNQLCSRVYGDGGGVRNSSFFACTTSLLSLREQSSDQKIAPGLAGMFWLALVGHNENWGEEEERAAEEILRITWMLLISEHLNKRHLADIQRGRMEVLSSAAHDLKYLIVGIDDLAAPRVLDLIREYFKQLITHSALAYAAPDTNGLSPAGVSGPIILAFPFRKSCTDIIHKAGHIEKIIELAKSSKLRNKDAVKSGLEDITNWINKRLKNSWSNLPDDSYQLTELQITAFELALIAGFRNAIHHSRKADPEGSRLEFRIEDKGDNKLLIIENILMLLAPSPVRQGKLNGTLGSLRIYARAYGKEQRLVDLKQIGFRNVPESTKYEEKWQTIIPLPNTIV